MWQVSSKTKKLIKVCFLVQEKVKLNTNLAAHSVTKKNLKDLYFTKHLFFGWQCIVVCGGNGDILDSKGKWTSYNFSFMHVQSQAEWSKT